MSVDMDRFMKVARVQLPGATDDALQLALFSVMDEFFRGSNVWHEDIVAAIPANDPAGTIYFITPTAPSLIDKLLWVFQLPEQPNIERGPAVGAAMATPGELTLALQPSSAISYVVTVALTVEDPVDGDGFVTFPAWVLAKYRLVLESGLVGRMMAQPNKPFTNPQMSVYHLRRFNSGVAQARVEQTRNNTYRQQAWRFPGSGGGSQRGIGNWAQPQ